MDIEKIKAKLNKIKDGGKSGGDNNFFTPQEGKQMIRFLPYESEQPITEGLFYTETKTHFIEDNGQKRYIHCPYHQDNSQTCPICQVYFEMWNVANKLGGPTADKIKDLARSVKPRLRYFANILDREDDKVKIYSYGSKLQEKLLELILDEDVGDFTDFKTGRDIKLVKKTVDGKFPNYDSSMPDMKITPISEEAAKTYEEQKHSLEKCVKLEEDEEYQRLADILLVQLNGIIDSAIPKSGEEEEAPFDGGENFEDHLEGLKG